MELTFHKAERNDCKKLTDIAITSKRNWGYTDNQMKLWEDELIIKPDYINQNIVYKIFAENDLIGFYSIKFNSDYNSYELEHLWLLPEFTQKGFGRAIFNNVIENLNQINQSSFIVISEPNSNKFYEKMGGKFINKIESKIKNRYLSVYKFDIN